MSESLRDQLLKSGLAKTLKPVPTQSAPPSRSRAKSDRLFADRSKRPAQQRSAQQRSPSADRGASDIDLAKAYALRNRNEREQRESEQKAAELRAREKKERRQKIATLVNGAGLNATDAEIPRHFPHANKIRRIYVNEAQLPQLNGGELAVVQHAGRYLLVTREKALAVRDVDADAVVLLCEPQGGDDDGVPADLVW